MIAGLLTFNDRLCVIATVYPSAADALHRPRRAAFAGASTASRLGAPLRQKHPLLMHSWGSCCIGRSRRNCGSSMPRRARCRPMLAPSRMTPGAGASDHSSDAEGNRQKLIGFPWERVSSPVYRCC